LPVSATDLMRRQQRANAFCEAIRAVDATGLLLFVTQEIFFFLPFPILQKSAGVFLE